MCNFLVEQDLDRIYIIVWQAVGTKLTSFVYTLLYLYDINYLQDLPVDDLTGSAECLYVYSYNTASRFSYMYVFILQK